MNVYGSCMGDSLISAKPGIREYVLKGCCLWGFNKGGSKACLKKQCLLRKEAADAEFY